MSSSESFLVIMEQPFCFHITTACRIPSAEAQRDR